MSQSLPDDTLRKIQQQAVNANRNLSLTKAQLSAKERERRMVQLTIKEISELNSADGKEVKMFIQVPKADMEGRLNNQEKELSDEVDGLTKKSKYLEKEFNEAQGQLRDIFQSSTRR
ncbi:SubName: Full=Uncharacterized protein {ECO:0000313/EMBL:CCA67172.1} [Serendipita indica DSM 11827]|nr:SubName: Full=Uncharacterized protein {ECO:0000313/EMBL:CCA67172.1} [Serendipita indica DSM 11827]